MSVWVNQVFFILPEELQYWPEELSSDSSRVGIYVDYGVETIILQAGTACGCMVYKRLCIQGHYRAEKAESFSPNHFLRGQLLRRDGKCDVGFSPSFIHTFILSFYVVAHFNAFYIAFYAWPLCTKCTTLS